jgi:hypothetical protein
MKAGSMLASFLAGIGNKRLSVTFEAIEEASLNSTTTPGPQRRRSERAAAPHFYHIPFVLHLKKDGFEKHNVGASFD